MKKVTLIIWIIALLLASMILIFQNSIFIKIIGIMTLLSFFIVYSKAKINTIKNLENQVSKILNIEQMDYLELEKQKEELKKQVEGMENQILKYESNLSNLKTEIQIANSKLVSLSEEIEFENFALYKPRYNFSNSSQYKAKLEEIRKLQKEMIKNKSALNYSNNWTVDGSKSKGKKMTNDNIKMILRCFNADCEAAINKIKFNNLSTIENRIFKSFEQLNSLNVVNKVSITNKFMNLKLEELHLGYEYEQKSKLKLKFLEKKEKKKEKKRLYKEKLNIKRKA